MVKIRRRTIRATILIMRYLNVQQGTISDLCEYTGYDKVFLRLMLQDMVAMGTVQRRGLKHTGKMPAQLYSFNKSQRLPEDE